MNRPAKLAAGAASFGLAVGLVAALAIPHDRARADENAGGSGATIGVAAADGPVGGGPFHGFATAPRVAAARGASDFSQSRVQTGTVHEELRRADPAGGPVWVVRSYIAQRVMPKAYRRRGVPAASKPKPCVQIGREVGGRFGWVDGSNVFRPVRPGESRDVPATCFSTKLSVTHQPELMETTLLARPASPDASVRGSIVWGVVGRPVQSVSLKAAGQTSVPELSARYGVFLQFYGAERSAADAELTTQYPTGGVKQRSLNPPEMFASMNRIPAFAKRNKPVDPGTAQLMARASDPAGGPSWGVLAAKSTAGFWCTYNSGYAIDGRVGNVDVRNGTLWEEDRHRIGCSAPDFKQYPIMLSSSFGSEPGQDSLGPARGKLRLQSGRSTFSGMVDPAADLVTISTPRDIRSVVPTGPAHVVMVVYDGDISGRVTFAIHYPDGKVRHQTENAGF